MASIRSERGRLFLDFRWKGVRCREWTGRSDTPTDRAELKKLIRQIDGEIAAGTFEYIKRFPEGSRRNAFAPPSSRKLPPSVDILIVDFPGPRRCPCESRGSRRARSSRS